jgi:clan AA aspartic protease
MVTGTVNAALEGTVRLPVQGAQGQWRDVETIVDSAFTRWMTLPSAAIRSLGLSRSSRIQLALADGSISWFDTFEATVIWGGRQRIIEVDASESCPLLGTRMMAGYELRMKFILGGALEIEELP